MNYNKDKSKLIEIQLIATILFIIALFLSYILAYDEKLSLDNKKRLFSNKKAQNIESFQAILLVIVSLIFLYVSYNQYKIAKKENTDKQSKLNLLLKTDTSVLSLVSALVGIYVVYKNYNNNLSISEIENV